jgi:PadR family transcriptional regulator, regulatory protein AphA
LGTVSSKPVSTTHYALLCLLSARPGSAYELVQRSRRSISHIWPRAESNLYTDLKRLAAEGLASSRTSYVGRRARTTYRITRRGRTELRRWLASTGTPPSFECEALLKLGFAPETTKDAALAQVAALEQFATDRLAFGRTLAERYLDGEGDEPERTHINAVMWRYLWQMHSATAEWAKWARSEIEAWPDTGDHPAGRERGLAAMRTALRKGRGGTG